MTGMWPTGRDGSRFDSTTMDTPLNSVLYLSPYFWPEEIGSSPYCTDLAVWLREQGRNVSVVAFRPHYPNPAQFALWSDGSRDVDVYEGVSIRRVAVKSRGSGGFADRIRNDLSYLLTLISMAFGQGGNKPSAVVVYVPGVLATYGAWLIAKRHGARLIVVVHDIESGLAKSVGLTSNRFILALMRFVERIGFNRADHLVVLTEGMKREIAQIGCRRPITVLPIWTQLPPAVPAARNGPIRIMYSGNFGKKQGLRQLLPLFQRLTEGVHGMEIVMRGDGSEKAAFQEQAAAAGIVDIHYLPLASKADFFASLQSAHIHLVPQALNVANYAMPSKLYSIMSAGRPFACIAAKDSPLDVLARESGAGICVQPGEDELLYRRILDICSDFDLQDRMGENGRRYVEQNMNKETIMRAYGAVIGECAIHPGL